MAQSVRVITWFDEPTAHTDRRSPRVGGDAMTLPAVFFYLFAGLTVAAGSMVIMARNPVHAVLFLILAFFNAAGLFVLLGAEFLAMILVVVYVGAVAVLFLFVVMMLDVDFAELRAGFVRNAPLGAVVGLILLGELIMVVGFRVLEPGALALPTAPIPTAGSGITNTEAIGRVLYTKYAYYFEGAGLILLVAMIGAIVLTLRHKEGVKRQSIAAQVARGKNTAIDVVNLPPGGAIVPAGTERRG
jgi:NADH-quinone oxidoreductase subunit J